MQLETKHASRVLQNHINCIHNNIDPVELGLQFSYECILLNIYAGNSITSILPNTKDLLGLDNAFEQMIEHLNGLGLIEVEKTSYGRITNLTIKDQGEPPIKYYCEESKEYPQAFKCLNAPSENTLARFKHISSLKTVEKTSKIMRREPQMSSEILEYILKSDTNSGSKKVKYMNVVSFPDKVVINPKESYVITVIMRKTCYISG
ncbi:hypothetical protein [Nonlabens agnitus]|uniref:Uncharacterized protein n=1 Tax=Nonlabens agnitus TaxID=870484 RepID=A0A2S9WQS1_9FLAO|nr:hypothetical protein [Nonlabens agnitus]PRP65842.1 hypothetical protein BST86_01410 [Nonlabens agnitus]